MSWIPLMFPVQTNAAKVILERAREDMQFSKKEMAAALGYSESEYSKALNALRPCDLHDIRANGTPAAQLAIARAWVRELNQRIERDLVADTLGRIERLMLEVIGQAKPAKAELRDDVREKVSA